MTGNPYRESLAGERDPKRVVAFSDGIIAIAVTLLVLSIRPPDVTARRGGLSRRGQRLVVRCGR
jgi:uncharacterized membrane protein